jgi:iron complex outermembrane receptor protein
MNANRVFATSLAAAIAAVSGGTAASAELEEIIVTAQKREQSIQDVGISISAFTGDQIQRLGIVDSTALARLVPGVHLGGSNGGQTLQYTIRGDTQNDFSDHTESPVAVYVDDAYLVMSQAQKFATYDVDRVEVLRGPQGTLFGRNATGGLVHFLTRRPTSRPEGYFEAEYGAYDTLRVEGAVSGPLTGNLNGRLSAMWRSNDAYLDNDYDPTSPEAFNPSAALQAVGSGDDLGAEDNAALRGQLEWIFGEGSSLRLIGNWARSKLSTPYYQSEPTAVVLDAQGRVRNEIRLPADSVAQAFSWETGDPILSGVFGPFPRPVPGGDITGYRDPDGRGWDHTAADFAFDSLNEMETYGLTAKLDWNFGGTALTSITDYKSYDKLFGLDVDSAPMNQGLGFHDSEIWQATQELRLSGSTDRFRWVTGLYYLHADYSYRFGFRILDNGPLLFPPGTVAADYPVHVEQQTDNYSLFAQGELDMTPALTLIAGARIMREEKDFDYALEFRLSPADPRDSFVGPFIGVFSDVVGLPVPTATQQHASDPLWAGKLQLDWRPADGLLLYAGINRGVKAGGFNAPGDFGATQLRPGFDYPYQDETLLAYEGGFKATLFGGTTRLNGSVFYYDYSDYQGFLFAGIVGVVSNNDATAFGGELELSTTPFEGLELMLGVSAIDAEVEDVETADGVLANVEPAYTPPLKVSGLASYGWPMLGGRMAIQADVTYTDRLFDSLRNFDSHELESYWLANARVSWTAADESWQLAALVNNVTDEEYPVVGFGVSTFCGCSEIGVGRPRWWGLQLRRNF